MTKLDLFSLSIFILFVLFCIPGTCVSYNSWKKIHLWSNNQLSCSILRKIFAMRVGDYEQIINYDWPNHNVDHETNQNIFLNTHICQGFAIVDENLNSCPILLVYSLIYQSQKFIWSLLSSSELKKLIKNVIFLKSSVLISLARDESSMSGILSISIFISNSLLGYWLQVSVVKN